jgi:type 1 glutamine amidotransferase
MMAAGGLHAQQAATAGQGQGPGQGRAGAGRGGRGGAGTVLFGAADADKNGSVTRAEFRGMFDRWFPQWDGGTGSLTQEQLATGLNSVFPAPPAGRGGAQNQTPKPEDVAAMMAALPDTAPARPAKPRRVLVLAKAQGFVHSSIPLAAKTVEALGDKTHAWSTVISYDPADINAKNLAQYDAIFLDSTTGTFLDDPNDAAATAARRKALLDFVRGGKGLAGIHAATDSYHGNPTPAPRTTAAPAAPRGQGTFLAMQLISAGDKNADQKLSRDEFGALADALYDKVDAGKAGTLTQAEFAQGFGSALPPVQAAGRGRGTGEPQVNAPLWPEFNKMIGGYFKFHWLDPQHITVKIDDPDSPLTAMFHGQEFGIDDETYTFAQDSWSRDNVHVLTSIDYSKMSDEDRAKEPAATARTDHDFGLSWIRREGNGRVFYEAHGHDERIYAMKPMLEHLLAGIQYALGDLKADDTPSAKLKAGSAR